MGRVEVVMVSVVQRGQLRGRDIRPCPGIQLTEPLNANNQVAVPDYGR